MNLRPEKSQNLWQVTTLLCLVVIVLLLGRDLLTIVTSRDLVSGVTETPILATGTEGETPSATGAMTQEILPTQAAVLQMSVEDWEKKFLSIWEKENEDYSAWSQDDNAGQYYYLAYAIDGNVAMYEASGKKKYLDRALEYINSIMDNAKMASTLEESQYKDEFYTWITRELDAVDGGRESPLVDSFFGRYITRLLRVIRFTPDLYNDTAYRSQYTTIKFFVQKNIFDKYYQRDQKYIFNATTHTLAHYAYMATDLYALSENDEMREYYKRVYTKINQDLYPYQSSSLSNQLVPNPKSARACFWDVNVGKFETPGQDTGHGNAVVSYIIEAHDLGTFWTTGTLDCLRYLVLDVTWNGSLTDPKFSDYVDGSTTDIDVGYYQSDGYLKLGRYYPELQQIYEKYDGQGIYLTQYYGNAALNAKLLQAAGKSSP